MVIRWVRRLNDRLLIFSFLNVPFFPHSMPHVHMPSSSLFCKATQAHTAHRNNLYLHSAPHSITLLLGEQFWLIYIDCYGPFSIPGAPEQRNPSLLIHQTSTCQTLAQEKKTSVSFLPILFVFSTTNNCHVPNSQEGAVICYLSAFFNNALNTL